MDSNSMLEITIGERRLTLHGWAATIAFVAMVYAAVLAPIALVALVAWLIR